MKYNVAFPTLMQDASIQSAARFQEPGRRFESMDARGGLRVSNARRNTMSQKQPGGVMPMVAVPSVDDTRNFYVEKLGFEHQMGVLGKDGQLDFVNVVRDGASIMFSRAEESARALARQPVEFYVSVGDVDRVFKQVESRGVVVAEPLTDQWWGDRTFVVTDPNGYRVWFSTRVGEAVPPPGTKIV